MSRSLQRSAFVHHQLPNAALSPAGKYNGYRRPAHKTKMCEHWKKGGICKYGSRCLFAHGEHELQVAGPKVSFKPNALGKENAKPAAKKPVAGVGGDNAFPPPSSLGRFDAGSNFILLPEAAEIIQLPELFGVDAATIIAVCDLSENTKRDAWLGDMRHKDISKDILLQRKPDASKGDLHDAMVELEKNASMAAFLLKGTDLQTLVPRGVSSMSVHDLGTVFEALFKQARDQPMVARRYKDWIDANRIQLTPPPMLTSKQPAQPPGATPPLLAAGAKVKAKFTPTSRTWKDATVQSFAGNEVWVMFDGYDDVAKIPWDQILGMSTTPVKPGKGGKGKGKGGKGKDKRPPFKPAKDYIGGHRGVDGEKRAAQAAWTAAGNRSLAQPRAAPGLNFAAKAFTPRSPSPALQNAWGKLSVGVLCKAATLALRAAHKVRLDQADELKELTELVRDYHNEWSRDNDLKAYQTPEGIEGLCRAVYDFISLGLDGIRPVDGVVSTLNRLNPGGGLILLSLCFGLCLIRRFFVSDSSFRLAATMDRLDLNGA